MRKRRRRVGFLYPVSVYAVEPLGLSRHLLRDVSASEDRLQRSPENLHFRPAVNCICQGARTPHNKVACQLTCKRGQQPEENSHPKKKTRRLLSSFSFCLTGGEVDLFTLSGSPSYPGTEVCEREKKTKGSTRPKRGKHVSLTD